MASSAAPPVVPACASGAPRPCPPRRVLLLLNRHSARGAADIGAALESLRARGIDLVAPDLDSAEDMRERLRAALAEDHVERHVDAVVIGGGDGTLNTVADLLVGASLPIGVLPLGTANDLARTLGIPDDPLEASALVAAGWTMPIDLGRATWADGGQKHYFNVASLGASVAVARTMHRRRDRNARWGILSYPIAMVEAAWACRPFRAEIVVEDHRETVRAYQISVGNGVHYGGGMRVAEDAAIDDGALDVYVLKNQPPWRVLMHLPALRRGRHDRWEGVLHLRGRHVEVRPRRSMAVNTDGELAGRAPARFDVVRGALRVFVPEERARAKASAAAEREAWMSEDGWSAMRGDAEVALDDVTVGCKRTAEHLSDAAEVIDEEDPALAALFRRLADDRAALAADLERQMLEMDAFPGAPDADREFVGQLARRLRHVLSSHDREALLDDRIQESEDLAHDTSTARARDDIPPAAQDVLRAVQERVAAHLEDLKAARRDSGVAES